MSPYLPQPPVPASIPTAAVLVEMGLAHVRLTPSGTVYVIHDAGHRLLGELLRERGRG